MNLLSSIKANSSDSHLLWYVAIAVILTLIYAAAHKWGDKGSIRENLLRQGARLLSLRRCRRVDAWLLDENERFYEIRYRDRNGWEHEAVCKTSTFGGVYYADDKVIGQNEQSPPGAADCSDTLPHTPEAAKIISDLETENRRLKEELRRVNQHSPQ